MESAQCLNFEKITPNFIPIDKRQNVSAFFISSFQLTIQSFSPEIDGNLMPTSSAKVMPFSTIFFKVLRWVRCDFPAIIRIPISARTKLSALQILQRGPWTFANTMFDYSVHPTQQP